LRRGKTDAVSGKWRHLGALRCAGGEAFVLRPPGSVARAFRSGGMGTFALKATGSVDPVCADGVLRPPGHAQIVRPAATW